MSALLDAAEGGAGGGVFETPVSIEKLEDEITTLCAHLGAAEHRLLTVIGEFDARGGWSGWGIASCAHWLSWKCGLSLPAAHEKVRVARALRELPAVSAAMASGELSYSKVRAITRVATEATEEALVRLGKQGTASHVEEIVRQYRKVSRVEDAAEAARVQREREVRVRWQDDGSVVIRCRLPAVEGKLVLEAMEAAVEALRESGRGGRAAGKLAGGSSAGVSTGAVGAGCGSSEPAAPPPLVAGAPDAAGSCGFRGLDEGAAVEEKLAGESSAGRCGGGGAGKLAAESSAEECGGVAGKPAGDSSAEDWRRAEAEAVKEAAPTYMPDACWAARRADALVWMAETMLARGPGEMSAGERHQVVVHVDASALQRDAEGGRAELEHGPALSVETVRRLLCDGSVVPMSEDAQGNVLDVGRKTRAIPPALRRALRSRDGGCRFPGCSNKRHVDGHHIRHWADGGETKLDNLVLLCGVHHRLVHEEGFAVERAGGRLVFRTPDGRRVEDVPRHVVLKHDPVLALMQAQRGLGITARTCVPEWMGERPEYAWITDALWRREERARQSGRMAEGSRELR